MRAVNLYPCGKQLYQLEYSTLICSSAHVLSWLNVLASISSTKLNRSNRRKHTCLLLCFREHHPISHFKYNISCRILVNVFLIKLNKFHGS